MSDTPPSTDEQNGTESLISGVTIGRYDIVLLAIPLVFVIGVAVSFFLAVSIDAVLVGASIVAIAALADALFLHPPTDRSETQRDERPTNTRQATNANQAD